MSSVNKKLSSDDLFHAFFGEDYVDSLPRGHPDTSEGIIWPKSTLKPKSALKPISTLRPTPTPTSKEPRRELVFAAEPANIKCDKEKTPKFVRIDVKTGKNIKKIPFIGYMQPNVVDGRIVKNDDKSDYCINPLYPYLTWDSSKYKYCCSENSDTLEEKLKHCKDVLYHMFTGIRNHKKQNHARSATHIQGSTNQQFLNTIKIYTNIFSQIMNKQLQEQIQGTLTEDQKHQISELRQASDKAIETEKKKLTDLYTSNLTEDTKLSASEDKELQNILLELKYIPPENNIKFNIPKMSESKLVPAGTVPTTMEDVNNRFAGYFVINPETGMQEWVFTEDDDPKTPVFPNGGTRKRKPCNRRKKTRRKGSKRSKRMKKKNKAGKLKHSHKLRKLH
jgi:hypothetical protein